MPRRTVAVGGASHSNGTVIVQGATLRTGNLTVGASGTAEVTVDADGTITTGTLAIGSNTGAIGEVDVNASGTLTGRSISVGSGGAGARGR
jgi:T5SS/PEP-CTERM-associated repeat protein